VRELGYEPLCNAAAGARIAVVGQGARPEGPGERVAWDDAGRVRLRSWLGVDDEQFYDANLIALVPDGLPLPW
jgi:hypothetical protein